MRERFVAGSRTRRSGGALDIRASAAHRGLRRSLAHGGLLRFPADRIFKGVVETFTPGALEPHLDGEEWSLRFPLTSRGGRDRLTGTIGFRVEPAEPVRTLLERGHALAIKTHFALWARQFAESEGDPETPVTLTLSRLCDDLGFIRLQNGAHRPEHKRQAAVLLELLTSLEVDADYQAPDGRTLRLQGPIWRKSPSGETGEFTIMPGAWFTEPTWREFNGAVGLVGEGLLKLRQDRDRWTLCVAGYLASLARMNGYRPLTLRLTTLEARTGMLHAERRNPARRHEALERALDRCVEAGLIGAWEYAGEPALEPDMDSPSELAALSGITDRPEDRKMVIHWPPVLRGREAMLHAGHERHRANRRRSVRRRSELTGR